MYKNNNDYDDDEDEDDDRGTYDVRRHVITSNDTTNNISRTIYNI